MLQDERIHKLDIAGPAQLIRYQSFQFFPNQVQSRQNRFSKLKDI